MQGQKTKKLALSALLCALGTVLLCLGALLGSMDLTVAAIAALTVAVARIEMGMKYALAVYLGTSLLGMLLAPQKEIAVFYLLFFGSYTLFKSVMEQRRRLWELLGKLLFALLSFLLIWLICTFLLGLGDATLPPWYTPVLFALALLTFWVYDYALSKLLTFYLYRIHPKLPFHF